MNRSSATQRSPEEWVEAIQEAFARQAPPLELADQAIRQYPDESQLLYLAVVAALVEQKPERALRLQKRMGKRFILGPPDH
ncbi:MAG: hypothetical protein R3310_14380, partial [Candidatus Competibacteraceae bacterium]|nr:hypothetical protein [Candidatus Competibacteraceae bacterium]